MLVFARDGSHLFSIYSISLDFCSQKRLFGCNEYLCFPCDDMLIEYKNDITWNEYNEFGYLFFRVGCCRLRQPYLSIRTIQRYQLQATFNAFCSRRMFDAGIEQFASIVNNVLNSFVTNLTSNVSQEARVSFLQFFTFSLTLSYKQQLCSNSVK